MTTTSTVTSTVTSTSAEGTATATITSTTEGETVDLEEAMMMIHMARNIEQHLKTGQTEVWQEQNRRNMKSKKRSEQQ